MTFLKTPAGVLTLLSLIFITGCSLTGNDHNGDEHNASFSSSNTIDMGLNSSSALEKGKVEERIKEDIKVIRKQMTQLDSELKSLENNLTTSAQIKSRQLKRDLKRLQNNLEEAMAEVEKSSTDAFNKNSRELGHELEQVEDELGQIHAELQEWYDKNLN